MNLVLYNWRTSKLTELIEYNTSLILIVMKEILIFHEKNLSSNF